MIKKKPTQFEYLGRWVDTEHFRAFVYNKNEQKLAENYTQFIELLGSGLWFATKEESERNILKVSNSTPLEVKKVPIKDKKSPIDDQKRRENAKNHFKAAMNLGN